jgi:2-polyprenyl-3-methyl-5-hydroxy-6-metoxy-1,4-benzoquinol methylase
MAKESRKNITIYFKFNMTDTVFGKKDEYRERGDYHENLDPNWSYYPTYLAKRNNILAHLKKKPREARILDMGCGEGVFVKELVNLGFSNTKGVDLNCSSEYVTRGDILNTKFEDESLDVILLLDVIEHMPFEDQEKVLKEIHRLIKDDGEVIFSIPNLAHMYSRISFLLRGQLKRTANITKHPGDRPIEEYVRLIRDSGFEIKKRIGLFPTYPIFFNVVILYPSKSLGLYNLVNKIAAYPNFCFVNIIICNKKSPLP